MKTTHAAALAASLSCGCLSAQAFDFETLPQGVYQSPLVRTNGSQTLTVTTEGTPNGWLLMDDVSAPRLLGHVSCAGSTVNTHLPFHYTPLRFSFAHPVDAIAFAFGDNGGDDDSPVEIMAYDADDVLLGTLTAPYPANYGSGSTLSGSFGTAAYFLLRSGVNGAPNVFGNSIYFEVTASTITTVNVPPVLDAIANATVAPGTPVLFTATATDANWPAQALTFGLGSNAPAGATITPGGAFAWTPSQAQGGQSYPIDVIVTDNGTPPLSRTGSFTVSVDGVAVLTTDVTGISTFAGGTQNFTLDTSPAYASKPYLLCGSISGTSPGTPLLNAVLPLNLDFYLIHTATNPNAFPFTNSLARLDAQGHGTASLTLPPRLARPFTGITAHHAYIVLGPGGIVLVSNTAPVVLLP